MSAATRFVYRPDDGSVRPPGERPPRCRRAWFRVGWWQQQRDHCCLSADSEDARVSLPPPGTVLPGQAFIHLRLVWEPVD